MANRIYTFNLIKRLVKKKKTEEFANTMKAFTIQLLFPEAKIEYYSLFKLLDKNCLCPGINHFSCIINKKVKE